MVQEVSSPGTRAFKVPGGADPTVRPSTNCIVSAVGSLAMQRLLATCCCRLYFQARTPSPVVFRPSTGTP